MLPLQCASHVTRRLMHLIEVLEKNEFDKTKGKNLIEIAKTHACKR